jgi:hypothetical protein
MRAASWFVRRASARSTAQRRVEEFHTPDLVDGMVAELFKSTEVRGTVGKHVLDGLATLLPFTDAQATAAATQSAVLRNEV